MNTAHRTLSLLLLLLAMACTGLQAQTIVELKRGGTVRAKNMDDYKEELRLNERERADSMQYTDHLRRAFNALHADSLTLAESLFRQALKLRPEAPGNYILHYNLALIDVARGQLPTALDALDKVLKEHPDFGDARLTRAECLLAAGRHAEAVADCDALKPEARMPADAAARRTLFIRAAAKYALRRYADCRADLLTLLHADPQNESALLIEALTLQHMGQPTEAINKLNLIVAAYPQSADALATRASVLYGMKRYALARADYDRLVSMQPREAEWLVERARCLVALGEKTAARRDLDKAVQLGTPQGVVQALYNLTR